MNDHADYARARAREKRSTQKKGRSAPSPEPTGTADEDTTQGLALTCLSTIAPQPIHWLVPGYLPLGKTLLIAGDGGHGKSSLTLGLTADLTQGRPCFGLTYEALPPADVLLISCED